MMQCESRYAGMTTDERLFDAGLLSEWKLAASSRNRERMIELLEMDRGHGVVESREVRFLTSTVAKSPLRSLKTIEDVVS